MDFQAKLRNAVSTKKTSLCLGIDPHDSHWPKIFNSKFEKHGEIAVIEEWANSIISAASPHIPAVKFQSSMFEALGPKGVSLLKRLISHANDQNLLTILDAKRGDIESSMRAYGKFSFNYLKADSLTVSPYMGYDVLSGLSDWLKDGFGAYVVWRSSNESAHFIHNFKGNKQYLADAILEDIIEKSFAQGIQNSFGLVLGATALKNLEKTTIEHIKDIPLLLPGFGAQGASPPDSLMNKILQSNLALFPQSRSLSGIGYASHGHENIWDKPTSTNHYLEFFIENLKRECRKFALE